MVVLGVFLFLSVVLGLIVYVVINFEEVGVFSLLISVISGEVNVMIVVVFG